MFFGQHNDRTGRTDVSDALQAVLNTKPPFIQFLPGNYLLSKAVGIQAPISLDGSGATIVGKPGQDTIVAQGLWSGLKIGGLTVLGNLNFAGISDIEIGIVHFSDTDNAITAAGVHRMSIHDCTFTRCSRAILIIGNSWGSTDHLRVMCNTIVCLNPKDANIGEQFLWEQQDPHARLTDVLFCDNVQSDVSPDTMTTAASGFQLAGDAERIIVCRNKVAGLRYGVVVYPANPQAASVIRDIAIYDNDWINTKVAARVEVYPAATMDGIRIKGNRATAANMIVGTLPASVVIG